mmetsp:Transcript_14575/g.22060  ORF Transcript_14575/g.22060 Transcript_14575/m.22060 type:complete len:277 (-) Transcript_14575:23-853(-)
MILSQQCVKKGQLLKERQLLRVEQLLDQLHVMISKERFYSVDLPLPLASSVTNGIPSSPTSVINSNDSAFAVCPKNRNLTSNVCREVCQWMYKVIDHYQFDRKIVAIAMNFFVRYINLSSDESDDMEREIFEIIPATALYLAIKLFGPKLSRHDNLLLNFVQMSNSRFDESHFVQMEIKMLAAFSWHVHPVTPQDFIPYFIEIVSHYNPSLLDEASNKPVLIEVSIYIVELIVFDQQFVYDSPSSIAIAAIAIALKSINTTTATATTAAFGYQLQA